jgi:hypothetical protein
MTDHPLTIRAGAAQATLDEWRARPLRLGHADCVRMAAAHLRHLGYRVKLPATGSYRTVRGALSALRRAGYASVQAALDALGLERIAPAAAIIGDIIELECELPGLPALTVALGNGRVIGFHPDYPAGAVVMQPLQAIGAWRVEPRLGATVHAEPR